MKSGRHAKRMPPVPPKVMKLHLLPPRSAEWMRSYYLPAVAEAVIAKTDEFARRMKVSKYNYSQEYTHVSDLHPKVALLNRQECEEIIAAAGENVRGVDWFAVHKARCDALREHERCNSGVPLVPFEKYLERAEGAANDLLWLLDYVPGSNRQHKPRHYAPTAARPDGGIEDFRRSVKRRLGVSQASELGVVSELKQYLDDLHALRTAPTSSYCAAPTLWIATLTADLAAAFEGCGLHPTSGRGAKNDPPFRKFVAAVMATLPVSYDGDDFALTAIIDDALKARRR